MDNSRSAPIVSIISGLVQIWLVPGSANEAVLTDTLKSLNLAQYKTLLAGGKCLQCGESLSSEMIILKLKTASCAKFVVVVGV